MTPAAPETISAPTAPSEPQAGRAPVPVWLFVLCFVLFYGGAVYFDLRSGWFNQRVYVPYRSLEQVNAMQPISGEADFILHGKQLFIANCAVCHMETGTGNPGNGCPNLVGSEWVSAPGPDRLVRLVSFGATGPIEVNGKVWNGGTMLAIGNQLPGDEKEKAEKIAAIISYIRKTFGNNASLVAPEQVEKVRDLIKDHAGYYNAEELKAAPEKE